MIRTLLLIAAASFVLMLAAFGGAAALGGPELLRNGWTIDVGDNDSEAWSGPTVERTLEWTGGDRLTVALPADVVFTQGDTPSVVVSGPETAVQRITLVDGRLAFADENGASERFTVIGRSAGLTVTITAPDVSRFELEGAGDLTLNGIDRDELVLVVAGAGDIAANGRAGTLNLMIAGAGDADLATLATENADVRIAGAGGAEVNASQSANIVIAGVGNVDLVQRPAHLTQEISGVGSVDVPGE